MLHKCPHCSFSAHGPSHVKTHIDTVHLKLKPYICKHCSRGFGQNSQLQRHIRQKHLKLKPYKCIHCPKSFKRNSTLQQHIRQTHLKLKPYICKHCSRGFGQNSTLQQHIKATHLGQKTHECQLCGQKFAQKNNLQDHVNMIHKNMSYREVFPSRYCEHNKKRDVCPICDPLGHLKNKITARLRIALKTLGAKKNFKTQETLGCSYTELQNHLQKKIEHWNATYGAISGVFLNGEFHLDHIKPLSTAKNEEEVKQLNHYTNLQLIWKHVNFAKSDIWNEEDEKYWLENIFQNPDYLNIYLPDSIWPVVFPSTQQ